MASQRDSRKSQIIGVFVNSGGAMSTRQLARACIDDGVYSQIELDNYAIRAVQNEVREALKTTDLQTGLPLAGPSVERDDEGQSLWKQLALWNEDDSLFNISERDKQARADLIMLHRLADNHKIRWGYRPEILQLAESELLAV